MQFYISDACNNVGQVDADCVVRSLLYIYFVIPQHEMGALVQDTLWFEKTRPWQNSEAIWAAQHRCSCAPSSSYMLLYTCRQLQQCFVFSDLFFCVSCPFSICFHMRCPALLCSTASVYMLTAVAVLILLSPSSPVPSSSPPSSTFLALSQCTLIYAAQHCFWSTAAVYVLLSAGFSLAHPKQLQCFNMLLLLFVLRVTRVEF